MVGEKGGVDGEVLMIKEGDDVVDEKVRRWNVLIKDDDDKIWEWSNC